MRNLEDSYRDALSLFWEEKYSQAFEILSYLSLEKYYAAYNELAVLYESGLGVDQDYKQALFFYKKFLNHQREVMVMRNLAGLYLKMNNFRQAKYWWNKGISLGDGECAFEYANALVERKSKNVGKIKELLLFASHAENMTDDSLEEAKKLLEMY